ncbi:diacylglycerol/lipid kinase family protein [Actimicrobium sp. CCC2.4]|uniref:diacylglycerol/lipid kinase family protein n=1 Tax=Actimicrobium sp. CCC2.4 TaxID=3048606 RepID=UPI003A0FCF4E
MPALTQALDDRPTPLDVLHLQSGAHSRYFINGTSPGITAMVAARVNAWRHRNVGTFLGAALRELVNYTLQRAGVSLDGQRWREGFFTMVVVANGTHFAKGMRIAPSASAADGLADISVVEATSKALLLAWLPRIYVMPRHPAGEYFCDACTRGARRSVCPKQSLWLDRYGLWHRGDADGWRAGYRNQRRRHALLGRWSGLLCP